MRLFTIKGNEQSHFNNSLKKIVFFSKNILTNPSVYDIISMLSGTERWLSWSKAHDWKSCER